MQRRKVFILGDSHTTAIAEAVKLRQGAGRDIDSPLDFYASRLSKQKANGSVVPGLSPEDTKSLALSGPQDRRSCLRARRQSIQYLGPARTCRAF